jgi:heme/copper-type cytochrome/quinol oxidase subunit 2
MLIWGCNYYPKGINHGFMPIVIEAVNEEVFLEWLIPKNILKALI